MNELNMELQKQFRPMLAIVAYHAGDANWNSGHYYLESHEINESGQLLAGKPLQAETIGGMVEIFREKHQQETRINGTIPNCLLHYTPGAAGEYKMVWHRPATQKFLHFTPELKLKSGLAMVPPLLYLATGNHLKVYALAGNRRPTEKTRVYGAPLHNVSTAGVVCLGSAKVKQPSTKTFENLIAYWEEMFWGSKFSAVHNPEALSGGITPAIRAQLRKPTQPFPIDKLPKPTRNLKNIIDASK